MAYPQGDHGPRFGFRPPHAVHAVLRLPGWGGRLKVAHLTDMHFGQVTPMALQRGAVELANRERPDLTLLTGDFVARSLGYLDRLTETLAGIEGRKIAVLGNHDHWSGAEAVRQALTAADIEVISNAWTRLGDGEEALNLVCMDDYGTSHHDHHRATAGLRGRPALGLSHNPEGAPLLWGRGVGLVLSGHTHGGQLHLYDLTRRFYQSALKVRYLDGWYEELGHQVYVNPGVGSSVVPFRYGRPAWREVAILDLEGGPVAPPEVVPLAERLAAAGLDPQGAPLKPD